MSDWASLHCTPLAGQPPLSEAEVRAHLPSLPGWSLAIGALERSYRFADFHRTMAFVNAVAWIAHREDHHPDVSFGYDRCTLRYRTHSVDGVSPNDFICAAKVDALSP